MLARRYLRCPANVLLMAGLGATLAYAAALTVTTTSLSSGTVRTPYSATLIATGGTLPYTWALKGTLPSGLSLSSKGVISGVPTLSSTQPFPFGVTVTDATGASVLASLSIRINASSLSITTPSPLPGGIVGVEYPERILQASGGASPYSFAITSGKLPDGMQLDNGVIEGTPTVAGSFTITVTVTDTAGTKASAPLSLTIAQPATTLLLSSGSLSFSLAETATTVPTSQRVRVLSSVNTQQINYTVTTSAAATWLSVTGGLTTPGALDFNITDAALPLNPGVFTTTVTITCTSTACQGKTFPVPVTLTITSVAPRLRVLNDVISFNADATALTAPMTAQLQLRNSGGSTLTVNSIVCHAAWCTVGALPSPIGGGATVPVTITATAGTLAAGTYRTTLDVDAGSAGTASTPVTLTVPRKPAIGLPAGGGQFNMAAGGAPAKTTGTFSVTATGGAISWTATAIATPAWLTVTTPSGTASPTQRGTVQYSINTSVAAGLAAKVYYGAIRIAATGVSNSPLDYRVILNVNAGTVRPELEPAGLALTVPTTKSTSGSVSVQAGSNAAVTWQAAARTASGGSWLSVSPSTGTASAAKPGAATITANAASLAPGVYNGTVSFAFPGAAVRTESVTLIVTAAASGAVRTSSGAQPLAISAQAACSPSVLAIAPTGLVNDFSAPTAWPVPLAITLLNDCGATVAGAQVVATFTNGDPPLALPLIDSTAGLYAATWTPRRATSQVTINTTATLSGFPIATATLTGEVVPNTEPLLNAYAVLNVFNPQVGGALAPGTAVAMYGSNLAAAATVPTTLPLPTQLSGTQAIIGGVAAPLYYAGPGQINAQIPFELDPSEQYQVVISVNGALTTPQTIQMTPAAPGVAANTDTTIVAQHGDYTTVTAAAPAKPGEYIVLYVAGLGATDTAVASGAGAPASPLASVIPVPTVTLDGVPVSLYFAGLTPTQVGLYQINLQVPATLGNGNHELIVTPSSGAASNSTLLPVHN